MPPRIEPYKENMVGLRLSILAMLPLSFIVGYCSEQGQVFLTGTAAVLLFINYICLCRLAGMQVGSQGFLPRQTLAHAILTGTVATVFGIPWAFAFQLQEYTGYPYVWFFTGVPLVLLITGSMLLVGAGTTPIWGFLICLLKGLAPFLWPLGETPPHGVWMALATGTAALPLGLVKYRYEQCSLALVPLVLSNSLRAGADLGTNPIAPFWTLFCLMPIYLQILWMRRKRVLPPSLRGCKFVTLSYIRKIAASGEGIRRCQDLPPEAFGDPRKARFLIVVSHRWMDRLACDQATSEYPEGLRLHFLLQKLNCLFSTEGLGQGEGWAGKIRRLKLAMTGGSDVLVFFDFMSLPQDGRSKDGTIVPRTAEETRTFMECLPNMGVLYSMFPVLVCPEVVSGHTAYLDSGWCFSESATAWLGQQLARFPTNEETRHWYDQQMSHPGNVGVLGDNLDDILATKTFLYETDRSIARIMIRGFVLKRRLICSLRDKSIFELRRVLLDIERGGFGSLVDQPVDAALNTPLHYAVAMNFSFGVQHLMDAGADKSLSNIYGDTPVQLYMLPRLGAAARLCRRLKSRQSTGNVFDEDTYDKLAQRYTLSNESAAGEISSVACGQQSCMGESSTTSPRLTHAQSQDSFGCSGTILIEIEAANGMAIEEKCCAHKSELNLQRLVVNLDDVASDFGEMSESPSLAN